MAEPDATTVKTEAQDEEKRGTPSEAAQQIAEVQKKAAPDVAEEQNEVETFYERIAPIPCEQTEFEDFDQKTPYRRKRPLHLRGLSSQGTRTHFLLLSSKGVLSPPLQGLHPSTY
jgi:hypothetical protein